VGTVLSLLVIVQRAASHEAISGPLPSLERQHDGEVKAAFDGQQDVPFKVVQTQVPIITAPPTTCKFFCSGLPTD
jgi:hypothetical protein